MKFGYDLAYIQSQLKYWSSIKEKYFLLEEKRTGLRTIHTLKPNRNKTFITRITFADSEIRRIFGDSEFVLASRISRILKKYPYDVYCFLVNGKVEFVYTNFVLGCPEFLQSQAVDTKQPLKDSVKVTLPKQLEGIISDYLRWKEAGSQPLEDSHIQNNFVYRPIKNTDETDRKKYPQCQHIGCTGVGKYMYDGCHYCYEHRGYNGSRSK